MDEIFAPHDVVTIVEQSAKHELKYRHICIDVQSRSMEERSARLAAGQRTLAIVREVSPRPSRPVTVIIGPNEIPCDLDLLQKHSRFFARGRKGMVYGLPTSTVTVEAFGLIYKWMAKPHKVVPPQQIMYVYRAATYLKIKLLLDQFMDEFQDPNTTREEIGFYMYFGLHKLNVYVPFLRKTMRVHKFFLTLIGTVEFLELWPNAIVELLNSPNICVNSEVEVLIAAIIWLHHDYQRRCGHVERLLACVRFDSIPLEALLQLRQHCSIRGLTQLLHRPEIEKFIKSAPSHNNNIRYCNRRIWIYDQLCEYHHDAHCPKRNFITLGHFTEFQQVLRGAPKLHWWHRHQLNPYVHSCRAEACRRHPPSNGRK